MHLDVGRTYAARYRIARKLGEGAMGAVYEADHLLFHRRVALKVLHADVAQRHDAVRRFEREAQAAGRIGSPHIVEVLDTGELADGSRFLVMELLEGETLAERLRATGRMRPEEASLIACQVLAGLGAAHAAGIIHRDLKPANIFLLDQRSDFVKILDFGVSKFSKSTIGDEIHTTAPGITIGTPHYMSPEQAKGAEQIDARSDLYAVGVMLYECVSGRAPFDAGTFNELIFRIVLEPPPPLESFAPELDPAFVAIIRKAMAREPEGRYPSAHAMYEALSCWLAQHIRHAPASQEVPWTSAPERNVVPGFEGASAAKSLDAQRHPAPLLRRPWGLLVLVLGLVGLVGLVGLAVGGTVLLNPRATSVAVSAPSVLDAATPSPLATPWCSSSALRSGRPSEGVPSALPTAPSRPSPSVPVAPVSPKGWAPRTPVVVPSGHSRPLLPSFGPRAGHPSR